MATNFWSWQSRSEDFRKLLCNVSDKLVENDIHQIEYLRDLAPEKNKLQLLIALEKRGEFSPDHTEPLVNLLKEVNRHDLAKYVENEFQAIYPDVANDVSTPITDNVFEAAAEEDSHEDEFDRKNVGHRSFPMARKRRTYSDVRADSALRISIEMPAELLPAGLPISPTRSVRPTSRTLSVHSVFSDGSGKKVASSTTLISELDNSGRETLVKIEQSTDTAPSTAQASCSAAEPFTKSSRGSQKKQGSSGWKQIIFGWKGKRGSASHNRTSKCTWEIDSEVLLSIIEHKGFLQCIKSPQKAIIDVESDSEANPYVSLFVYPQGLYDDAEKSMTLQYKVTIPDDCPPIPTKATFDLSWEMQAKREQSFRTLSSTHKQCIQVKFKTGMGYIHRFLSHSQLEFDFKFLEICVHVSTAYSI